MSVYVCVLVLVKKKKSRFWAFIDAAFGDRQSWVALETLDDFETVSPLWRLASVSRLSGHLGDTLRTRQMLWSVLTLA